MNVIILKKCLCHLFTHICTHEHIHACTHTYTRTVYFAHVQQAKLAFERLALNREYHPFIAGPGGAVAKQISEQTGARINIPPSSLNKNEITVAGDKEAVAKAVAQIQKIYRDMVRAGLSLGVVFSGEILFSASRVV